MKRFATCVALLIAGAASFACSSNPAVNDAGCSNGGSTDAAAGGAADGGLPAGPFFKLAFDLPMTLPNTNKQGDPSGGTTTAGGQAVAIFDANGDGLDDIALIPSGKPYYELFLNSRDKAGREHFTPEPPTYVGVTGDGKANLPDGFGLQDFNNDGRLDLYLCNEGKGGLELKNPRPPWDTSPANVDDRGLYRDSGYRTQISNGDGTFSYRALNANADGTTRSAVFADFDGDGHVDMFTSNAPYFGVWWGGSSAPDQLRPGKPDGSFGDDILQTAVTGAPADLWRDKLGRADTDFKGIVVRDFDGDGKPDIILSAFSDVWDHERPPLAPAAPSGANVDLDGDGVGDGGYQGNWKHGIVVLRNTSTPGHISFKDVTSTAIDDAFGATDQMHVYVTVPADIDNDGDLDLLVSGPRYFFAANSFEYETDRVRVYRNDSTPGHIRFTDITRQTGMDALNDDSKLKALSQGLYPVTVPDLMLDGSNFVMTPLFSAAAAIDVNNDGWVDWVLVDRQLLARNPVTNAEFTPWVFLNDGHGHFKLVPPRVSGLSHTARELSYADLNQDGRVDLVFANGSGGGQFVANDSYVYLNQIKNSNHWLEIKVQLPGNAFGIGTKVTVYQSGTSKILGYDEVRTDFAYRSKKPPTLHFGLGPVDRVDVKLVFRDGTQRIVRGLAVDRVQVLGPR